MENWIDCIKSESQKRLSEGRILFLSQIPFLLERNGFDPRATLSGRTLRAALEFEASDKIILVNNPESALEWAVLPNVDTSLLDLKTLFRGTAGKASQDAPRFESWFWGAFVKHLSDGKRRYLGTSRFYDLLDGEAPPPRSVEVRREEIAEPSAGEKADPDAVLTAINAWSKRNGVDLAAYYRASLKADRPRSSSKPEVNISPFGDFDDDDLRRILVPLDIVSKILRRR